MSKVARLSAQRRRPMPPPRLLEQHETLFAPAPEVLAWLQHEILEEGGRLHNPEHRHLLAADLAVLWASEGFTSKGRAVIGQAEMVMFRAGGWQKARQELQMREWFGRVPKFLITLDATYCAHCGDAEFCALVEHELYHVAQERDEFGAPKFTQEGLPKIGIRGHDVEEFVGVVRRYGIGDPAGAIAQLAAAARGTPEVGRMQIAGACGTCQLRAA
jgi:hypothetical protein